MGRAIARSFALEGDRVAILGRRAGVLAEAADELNAEAGGSLVSVHAADLSVAEEVEPLADLVGDVDVIVNCAGGVDRADPTRCRSFGTHSPATTPPTCSPPRS